MISTLSIGLLLFPYRLAFCLESTTDQKYRGCSASKILASELVYGFDCGLFFTKVFQPGIVFMSNCFSNIQ